MKIRAQIGMVLNLDKCIGCHTCSVTCKNVWTSRPGMEYAWFNNVETKECWPRRFDIDAQVVQPVRPDRRGRSRRGPQRQFRVLAQVRPLRGVPGADADGIEDRRIGLHHGVVAEHRRARQRQRVLVDDLRAAEHFLQPRRRAVERLRAHDVARIEQ